jgi:hypothetical protein
MDVEAVGQDVGMKQNEDRDVVLFKVAELVTCRVVWGLNWRLQGSDAGGLFGAPAAVADIGIALMGPNVTNGTDGTLSRTVEVEILCAGVGCELCSTIPGLEI